MTRHRSINTVATAFLFGSALLGGTAALAQTPPAGAAHPAPANPDRRNRTPPGGIARGVVPPPRNVDPGIVTPPPSNLKPSMPVIKPPGTSR